MAWFIGGKKINPDDKRFQVVVKDTVRKLVIKDTLLGDAGEITAKTNVDSTSGKLRVARKSFFSFSHDPTIYVKVATSEYIRFVVPL